MSRRLVTVAVYDLPPHAHIARETLEAAGIRAVVADDQMVGMDWLLSTAVGGVKVQVWDEDAGRALTVLESMDHHAEDAGGDESTDTDTDTAAPPETDRELDDDSEMGEKFEPTEADFEDEPEPAPSEVPTPLEDDDRTRLARRAFFTSVIGLGCFPVAPLAFYLCLNATFGPGPISRRGRFELILAWCFTPLGFLWPLYYFTWL